VTLYLFKLLSAEVQLRYVLERGTFLAQRWEDESGVNLYHCANEGRGFFVEVGMDDGQGPAVVLHSFVSNVPNGGLCTWGAAAGLVHEKAPW
jgi:hypothetical protein